MARKNALQYITKTLHNSLVTVNQRRRRLWDSSYTSLVFVSMFV